MNVIKLRSYALDLLEYRNRKKDSLSLFNNNLAEFSQRCVFFNLCSYCQSLILGHLKKAIETGLSFALRG
ncbi:MAG: hypothetical protein P1V97_04655 [Planctomycetota bacterium]|nr:hypothetical protein [Planctomycetota bacterium]